jgi:hypothetical protein
MTEHVGRSAAFAAVFFAGSLSCWAQAGPPLSVCGGGGAQKAAACAAVRGDPADGWAATIVSPSARSAPVRGLVGDAFSGSTRPHSEAA